MEKAQAAVSNFMKKAGHHDTTVHERVAPAVTHETVIPQKHENVTTAIDKEVHQDHHHTSIQPVKDKQVLSEQHHHNVVPVEQREFHHGKDHDVKSKLAETAAHFKDHQTVAPTKETHSAAPVVAGEHIHHHVHETIQPVVERETVQPHVVHTTVPVHEVHHNAAKVHEVSSLPAVHMADFKKSGGVLSGREERFDGFEGEPRSIGGGHHTGSHTTGSHTTGTSSTTGGLGTTSGLGSTTGTHHQHTDGPHHNDAANKFDPRVDSDRDGSNTTGKHTGTTAPPHKTGLMAKLNPKIDSDGDGKAGFMK